MTNKNKTTEPPTIRGVRKLIPIAQWPDHHAWPSVAGLRWMIFNKDKNGFTKAIVRSGRRVLIDEEKFFEWLDGQQANA
jgi:hypothetical protein